MGQRLCRLQHGYLSNFDTVVFNWSHNRLHIGLNGFVETLVQLQTQILLRQWIGRIYKPAFLICNNHAHARTKLKEARTLLN
ncbi:hypothetical protein D3C78_1726790 [compost metagenome]